MLKLNHVNLFTFNSIWEFTHNCIKNTLFGTTWNNLAISISNNMRNVSFQTIHTYWRLILLLLLNLNMSFSHPSVASLIPSPHSFSCFVGFVSQQPLCSVVHGLSHLFNSTFFSSAYFSILFLLYASPLSAHSRLILCKTHTLRCNGLKDTSIRRSISYETELNESLKVV